MHATPPEQVTRAVARGCCVGCGVEVVEEYGREESAMGKSGLNRKQYSAGIGFEDCTEFRGPARLSCR